MKAIENLDDLHNLFFSEWLLPFVELKNTDLILESNFILFNYVKNFGASIPKNNNQDHLEINQNSNKFELINFIAENSGNWNIAVSKKTEEIYTNEHWLYTNSNFSEYKKLNFGIEECLITFSLQEIYFAFCENNVEIKSELNLEPLWVNKRYNSMERTHSFFYDSELKALKLVHSENNFDDIAFIRPN